MTLPYWGQIINVIGKQNLALFICKHENIAKLYRLDFSEQRPTLTNTDLPVSMDNLCAMTDDTVVLIGNDGYLYQSDWQAGFIKLLSDRPSFDIMGISKQNENLATAIAVLNFSHYLAVLYPKHLLIWHYQKHQLGQCIIQLPLEYTATTISHSADGEWLVIGDNQGFVNSYHFNADKTALELSSCEQLHEGRITALAFEPIGQQFFSAGADKQLLRTHVQGKLQGIDRGKASNHTQMINCMLVTEQRLYTGSNDKSVKAWQFDKGQPSECRVDLLKIKHLAYIHHLKQPCVLTVNHDNSLRIIPVDDTGKLSKVNTTIEDGYQYLTHCLSHHDFTEAFEHLTQVIDDKTLNIVSNELKKQLGVLHQEQFVTWITNTNLTQTDRTLEDLMINNPHQKIRFIAFDALKQRVSNHHDIHASKYLTSALNSGFDDIQQLAIQQYLIIAQNNPASKTQVVNILEKILNDKSVNSRKQALAGLESLFPDDSPQADLLALKSNKNDIQQAGLIRLYQRNMLNSLEVKRQLALLQNSDDLLVRQTAFYIAILTQPQLAKVLKHSDAQFTRMLQDFEDFRLLSRHQENSPSALDVISDAFSQGIDGIKAIFKKQQFSLTSQELEPLLQGLSNPHTDISFRSAYALALLHDARAFGTLLRLIHCDDENIRMSIAVALGELGLDDAKSILPILLNDSSHQVRDSAMQAYGKLENDILAWVKVGFASNEQSIHQQALKLLLTHSKQQSTIDDNTIAVLTETLNNPFMAVRQEVAKVFINQIAKQNHLQAIHFLTQSHYDDIHQIAFLEWQSFIAKSSKAHDDTIFNQTLAQFLANPFEQIRKQAFNFVLKERKRFGLINLIKLAFDSPFVDIRKLGLTTLEQHKNLELLSLITKLFDDENHELRLMALTIALNIDNTEILAKALSSPYTDIQLRASQALARQGDDSSFATFEKFLQQPAPLDKSDKELKHWQENCLQSLIGMAELGDSRGFAWFDKFLHHPDVDFSDVAMLVVFVTDVNCLDRLAQWQNNENVKIKNSASFALAVWGDKRGELIFKERLSELQELQAKNGFGIHHVNQLQTYLQNKQTNLVSNLLIIFYDLLMSPKSPKLLLEALTIANEETAILFAGVIARYDQPEQVWLYVANYLNQKLQHQEHHQKSKQVWEITDKTLQALATFAVNAPVIVKLKTVKILDELNKQSSFQAWQSLWLPFYQRYHAQILPINQQLSSNSDSAQYWQSVAFGAWLGVLRQANYSNVNTVLKAMTELMALAKKYPIWQLSVQQVFLSLLNHNDFKVRDLAWQSLQKLDIDSNKLAETAISSTHADIVRQGLTLWLSKHEDNQANQQLQQLLKTSSPILTQEAYQILIKRIGTLSAGLLALETYYLPLRHQVVESWKEITDSQQQHEKQKLLQQAIYNDDWQTSYLAYQQLCAMKTINLQDYQDGLIELWQNSQNHHEQKQALQLIQKYFVNDNVDKILSLLDSPKNLLDSSDIYHTIAQMRNVSIVPKLLEKFQQNSNHHSQIYQTILTISGFDQSIQDYDNQSSDKRWLETQYPRHVDILLQLGQTLLNKTYYHDFAKLLENLAWVEDKNLSSQIDNLLLHALKQMPSQYTAKIIQAITYRVEHRQGSLIGLQQSLANKDFDIQFLSAEALAKQGIKDGFTILMATIDHNNDGNIRRRAVLALGLLADERAYDKLIKLAEDNDHYLQDVASEALGHLGKTDYGQHIFKLLANQLSQTSNLYNPAIEHWLNGLRWLNTDQSWQEIRRFIQKDEGYHSSYMSNMQLHAISLLQYNPDDKNREALLALLRNVNHHLALEISLNTAGLVWGNDKNTVYPYDWAVLQSKYPLLKERLSLQRISQFASVDELLSFISTITLSSLNHEVAKTLTQAILERSQMSTTTLKVLLNSQFIDKKQLGLRYLTKHSVDTWSKDIESIVWQQFNQTKQLWIDGLTKANTEPTFANQYTKEQQSLVKTLEQFVWLLMRYAQDEMQVHQLLQWLLDNEKLSINQAITSIALVHNHWLKQALLALLARKSPLSNNWINLLSHVDYWADAQLQQLASQITQGQIPPKTQEKPSLLQRFADFITANETQKPNSEQLIVWVKTANLDALYQLASDDSQHEALRISAIEGIGQINQPEVANLLQTLQQTDPDSDIQRSAFSALRRYQRRQDKINKG